MQNNNQVSCILPVYNNEETVEGVIKALLACEELHEVVVVDDASNDSSAALIEKYVLKINFIKNEQNLGKGGAMVKGINQAKGEILLFCDADLAKIKPQHIKDIISEFRSNDRDMVIAARETMRDPITAWTGTVSGERILHRKNIEKYLDLIATVGNGIEQVTNFAHRNKNVEIIISKDIGHVQKFQRDDPIWKWLRAYLKEVNQLIKTEVIIRNLQLKEIKDEKLGTLNLKKLIELINGG